MLKNVTGQPCAAVPRDDQGIQLCFAQLDERKLGGDKKAVGQNNCQYSEQPECLPAMTSEFIR